MKLFAVISVFLTSCLLAGCVGEEYHYVDEADLKPGPGLLSGEDGVFHLYGKNLSEGKAEEAIEEKGQKEVEAKK
jgi:hypothetical protein